VDCVLLVRVGIPSLKKEWKLFLARQAWKLLFVGFLCVAPLRLGGLRGKKSTPSIGWEVPVNHYGRCKLITTLELNSIISLSVLIGCKFLNEIKWISVYFTYISNSGLSLDSCYS
jgi:hypothetical protein